MQGMPTLYRFSNGKIEIRTRDHLPPHVHVLLNDGREVLVHLADGQLVMRQRVRRAELGEALAWIAARRAELAEMFEELQR